MKDKSSAAICALLLGGIGAHRFYLGQGGIGILYLFFCWTFIPAAIAFIEGIVFLTMSQEKFDLKYNTSVVLLARQGPRPQNVVVNVQNTAQIGATGGPGSDADGSHDALEQLKRLHELKVAGALTDEEFQVEKVRVLSKRRGTPNLT